MRNRDKGVVVMSSLLTVGVWARLAAVAVVALWLVGLGCGSEREYSNRGLLCLYPASVTDGIPRDTAGRLGLFTFAAGEVANIAVEFPGCLSSSCSVDRKASCSVAVNGNVLEVTSNGSYRQEENTCTADCGLLIARCTTPPLAAGSYTVRHGPFETTLTVPSAVARACFGSNALDE